MLSLSLRQLCSKERNNKLPLMIDVDGVALVCERVLRILPGKRIVYLASLAGSKVVVKLFIGNKCKKYLAAEEQGLQALVAANIITPGILWVKSTEKYSVLVLEYVDGEVGSRLIPDSGVWACESEGALLKVIEIVAKMHASGLIQADLHVDNFLFSAAGVITLDGAAVEYVGDDSFRLLENVALLFAQFNFLADSVLKSQIKKYTALIGRDLDFDQLYGSIRKYKEKRKTDYLKKVFRDCSEFISVLKDGFSVIAERKIFWPIIEPALSSLSDKVSAGVMLKNGNSATVSAVDFGDDGESAQVLLKRYNVKNRVHGIKYLFKESRARRSWYNANMLKFYGVLTPSPLAYIERRSLGLLKESYFACEYLESINPVDIYNHGELTAEYKGFISGCIVILQQLKASNIVHGDMKGSNFIEYDNKVWLIDLDAMLQITSKEKFEDGFSKDMKRFLRNWEASDVQYAFSLQQCREAGLVGDII